MDDARNSQFVSSMRSESRNKVTDNQVGCLSSDGFPKLINDLANALTEVLSGAFLALNQIISSEAVVWEDEFAF